MLDIGKNWVNKTIVLVDVKSNNGLQLKQRLRYCNGISYFGKKLVGKGRKSEVDIMYLPYYPNISPPRKNPSGYWRLK